MCQQKVTSNKWRKQNYDNPTENIKKQYQYSPYTLNA